MNNKISNKIHKPILKYINILLVFALTMVGIGQLIDFKQDVARTESFLVDLSKIIVENSNLDGDTYNFQKTIDSFISIYSKKEFSNLALELFLDNRLVGRLEPAESFLNFNYIIKNKYNLNNGQTITIIFKYYYASYFIKKNISLIFFLILYVCLYFLFKKRIEKIIFELTIPLMKIYDFLSKENTNNSLLVLDNCNIEEIQKISIEINQYTEKIGDARIALAQYQLAKQVSHDIRSPLITLKMTIEEIENISHEQKKIIFKSLQRIDDIANNLLNHNKNDRKPDIKVKTHYITSLIKYSLVEKQIQHRHNPNLSLISDLSKGLNLFSNLDASAFNSVISNLLNNAIEAVGSVGKVTVSVSEENNKILITIIDNGVGIPGHILEKLGKVEISYGKNNELYSGSGIGFYSAKKTIEYFNGELIINSILNKGSTVQIFLPKADKPNWFLTELEIPENVEIFTLSSHEIGSIWKDKLPKAQVFFKASTFINSIQALTDNNMLFLIDYELESQDKSGLNIIEFLNIYNQSILIINSLENEALIECALATGLRLILKCNLPTMDIVTKTLNKDEKYDYVYIEDDELLRVVWERKAKKNNIKILTLSSINEFNYYKNQICKKSTKIYLDSMLGDGQMRGEQFAEILHNEGYVNILMASAYEASNFSNYPWLKVTGKKCPF